MTMSLEQEAATAESTRLFELAGRESDTIRRLDGYVAELHAVLEARSALHRFSAAELWAALESRGRILAGGSTS